MADEKKKEKKEDEMKMAKHEAKKEDEAKMAKHEKKEAGEDVPVKGDHADAEQDEELIKQMLKKYIGKGEDEGEEDEAKKAKDDEDMACAMEAYEFHKKEHEAEKAAMLAVETMKAAKHLAAKHAEKHEKKEDEAKDEQEKKEGKSQDADGEDDDGDDDKKKKLDKDVQEARKEIAKLKGELAAFKESHKKIELAQYVETLCKESGLPVSTTKSFKESLKGELKSKEYINEIFQAFKAGRDSLKAGSALLESGLSFAVEKTIHGTKTGKSVGFGDCKGK